MSRIANGARMIAAIELVLADLKQHDISPEDIECARKEIREQAASEKVPEFVVGLANLHGLLEEFVTRVEVRVIAHDLPKVAQA